jgi:TrmH family RNA methyltransferase
LIEVVVSAELAEDERVRQLRKHGCAVRVVSAKTSAKLADSVSNQGIVAVSRWPEPEPESLSSATRLVALDAVQDPGNVGSIVRSAAWFGIDGVIAGAGSADFYNPKTVRAMAGSMWDLGLIQVEDLASNLKQYRSLGFELVGADLAGQTLESWMPAGRTILVVGSEGHGLSPTVADVLDRSVTIEGPRGHREGVESLNVSIAAGIILHHLRSGR